MVAGLAHAFTARMCAASRWIEAQRRDSLFADALASKLAGAEGMQYPMGDWILVPRTRFGDDHLRRQYQEQGVRQLVLLGAGMDARAWRMDLPELHVFEIDTPDLFNQKEPLVADEKLITASRNIVQTDFSDAKDWAYLLKGAGFDPDKPAVWLLEGLMMYLDDNSAARTLQKIGTLSNDQRSTIFFDAITKSYVRSNINIHGARFVGGCDDYGGWLRKYASFQSTNVWSFESIHVDRRKRGLDYSSMRQLSRRDCVNRSLVLFVESKMAAAVSQPDL